MKDGALRKKLQEIGIPNWGSKDLMRRRHIEWLNIHNSNCDADERVRRPKRQLLRELEEWENTQGGRADTKESKVMRKDFDGSGYAKSHKRDFDDLIDQARKKRAVREPEQKEESNGDAGQQPQQSPHSHHEKSPQDEDRLHQSTQLNGVESQGLVNHGPDLGTRLDGAQIPNHAKANPVPQPAE